MGPVYIEGEQPGTIFCRRCLVTLIVPDREGEPERTKHLHERQNPGRHGESR